MSSAGVYGQFPCSARCSTVPLELITGEEALRDGQLIVHRNYRIISFPVSAGNKMNAKNIATVFGPSLLRPDMTKQKPSLAHNEAVIAVVEALILYHRQLFTVTKETQDEVFRLLLETDPDSLDTLLYRRLQEYSTTEENE
ncbi:putative Rho GTPase-activating protein 6 [Trichinella spiralis]|uniref:putative Rho GTPase-activating protein 6 n=1 Tax=Trichinella spiralis TaxID=6334 RepID=UPI0001EFD720|nr:putative Rho GTPase-activating protein 6 [Trichinella spiralis]